MLLVGEPGSGKTRLGWKLSEALNLPFLARDQVRRGLFFTAGAWWEEPEGVPSGDDAVEAFLTVIETMASLRVSCIAEYVFRRHRLDQLRRITDVANCVVVETASKEAASRRTERDDGDQLFRRRQVLESLGYRDAAAAQEAREAHMRNVTASMLTDFPLPHLRVNTDIGYAPELDEIVAFVTSDQVQRHA